MTNTHINVGGHKITTNKVGEVHNLTKTSSVTIGTGGFMNYCVTNGICVISLWNISVNTTGAIQIATDIPKPKLRNLNVIFNEAGTGTIVGDIYNNLSTTNLHATIRYANSSFYGTLTYPVADDWVES